MRWVWLVWFVLVGAVAPATAGTMQTTMLVTDFGTVHVGQAGANNIQTLTIKNAASTGAAMAYSVQIDNADWLPVPASGSLAPNQSVDVMVQIAPSARGTRTGTLTVTTPDDASNPSDTFSLTALAVSGNMVVTWTGSPGALDFGSAAVSGGSSTRTITVSNPAPANAPLKFSLTVDGGGTDYAVPATVDVVLAVNASIGVIVTFDPTTAGTRTGFAGVLGDDGLNPSDLVSFTGVGLGAVFTPTPTSIDFSNTVIVGTFAEQTLSIKNTGNVTGTVDTIVSGNAVFTVTPVGLALPRTLAPNETLDVTVRFTPVNGMIVASNLSVTTSGTPASFQVPITGDGLYKAVTIVATNEADLMIDLGQRRVGVTFAQVITVTNTGEVPQNLALPTSSAAPCVVAPTNPATLPTQLDPAEAATFEIRVTPTAVGAGTCTVTVTTDVPSTDSVIVDWSGIAPEVELTSPVTPAINFGVVDVDDTGLIRTVVLHNTGSAPLAVGPCAVTGSARFSVITSCAGLSVTPGGSVTLMIGFDPTIEASESGTLNVGVDALSTQQVAVALTGVGADQRLDLSALAISFADTSVNTASAPIEYVDVHNPVNPDTGVAETLHISAATTDNAVFVLANEGPFLVEAGGMIRLAITFRPTDAGVYDGAVTIVSDASGQAMASIALHGRAIVASADEVGGCCDAGARPNAPLALLVILLVVRRRRRV